jgi:thiamine biosynthesis lipoprotein
MSGAAPGLLVAAWLLLAPVAGSQTQELLRLQRSADAMGATYSIILYGTDTEKMEAGVSAAFEEARRLDGLLSNYRPDTEWSRVNREGSRRAVPVSPELFRLLTDCQEYSRLSEGAFDITVGPLMKVWAFYKGTGALPQDRNVKQALQHVGYRHIHLNAGAQSVRFDRDGVEIDPGGIGKGYAVDRMVEVLRKYGFAAALITAGGSSIYGMGAPPSDPRGWTVTIGDPENPRRTAATVYLKDMSLSTSGSREKFFRAGGKTYSHIMDPRTGYPAQGTTQVSVVTPRTIDSEAWTKPYFVNGRRWASEHKLPGARIFLCEDKADDPCAWIP